MPQQEPAPILDKVELVLVSMRMRRLDLARLQAVTAADVQRVMAKYFTGNNRLVIYYLPESAKTSARSENSVSPNGGKGK